MTSKLFRPAEKSLQLSASFLGGALAKHTGSNPPPGTIPCDYEIYRSIDTGLEYAQPMEPGNDAFYSWLGGFDWYYPGSRWEYNEVEAITRANSRGKKSFSVLDVGCGNGEFLSRLRTISGVSCLGIETASAACQAVRARGIQVFNGTTTSFLRQRTEQDRFDIVSAFHVLEHVPDPVNFMGELVELAAPDGVVCLSTPLSPMFFECVWFDILNHPPHHLTRWTTAAYKALAQDLGLSVRFKFPARISIARQFLITSHLVRFGPYRPAGAFRSLAAMAMHPLSTLRIARALLKQRRTKPETCWDSVLVLLTREHEHHGQ